jgi:hypothetical protein
MGPIGGSPNGLHRLERGVKPVIICQIICLQLRVRVVDNQFRSYPLGSLLLETLNMLLAVRNLLLYLWASYWLYRFWNRLLNLFDYLWGRLY